MPRHTRRDLPSGDLASGVIITVCIHQRLVAQFHQINRLPIIRPIGCVEVYIKRNITYRKGTAPESFVNVLVIQLQCHTIDSSCSVYCSFTIVDHVCIIKFIVANIGTVVSCCSFNIDIESQFANHLYGIRREMLHLIFFVFCAVSVLCVMVKPQIEFRFDPKSCNWHIHLHSCSQRAASGEGVRVGLSRRHISLAYNHLISIAICILIVTAGLTCSGRSTCCRS